MGDRPGNASRRNRSQHNSDHTAVTRQSVVNVANSHQRIFRNSRQRSRSRRSRQRGHRTSSSRSNGFGSNRQQRLRNRRPLGYVPGSPARAPQRSSRKLHLLQHRHRDFEGVGERRHIKESCLNHPRIAGFPALSACGPRLASWAAFSWSEKSCQ